ncbi:uncharacterized protein LOC128262590 [Drosophila gunungcola]|uniref:uncharacterized protein LOC128262590 n=1 Tax=Drosophila gunungcola TaxID=103775 RepID=UPI0022E532BE|nr:uncharacterized protein LOC128262590 [Drosophila gunungcola]XP_052852891.1 uncharacterized protein LOC128262590 [Drosophila gunungcola]
MRQLLVYALISGLFYFSEGKPCPEKTRPHKTRCDAFYKCRELPSSSHVWIPVRCNEGLVYESTLGSCVLPGEDWECITPSEMSSTQAPGRTDSDILIVNDMNEAGLLLSENSHKDDGTVEIVLDSVMSSEEDEEAVRNGPHSEEDISSSHNFDSSGDGELVELDSPAPKPENREEMAAVNSMEHRTEVEKLKTELKQVAGISEIAKPGSPIDPNLTAHLQRLSQLIDGLQQTYQKTDKPQAEMRPDQLNAFLAHFDIKNRYEMMNPMEQTTQITTSTTTTEEPKTTPKLPEPNLNKSRLQEHLSHHRLQPETKLMLSNSLPYSTHGSTGQGYANSQIVVNRPEGSVMFALPSGYGMSQEQAGGNAYANHHPVQSHEYSDHEPKISEDTLKTVLELSKQMIAAQNLPKVLPNPGFNGAYYQPILQPVFVSPQGNPFQQYYGMPPPLNPHYMQNKKHSSGGSSSGYNKPSTTIIHNNVIPVHLSSTNSGEKEVLDTYGNSLGVYPSMDKHVTSNQEYMTTGRPISVTTTASTYGSQSPFASDYTLTTPRPFEQQPSAATVATYYTPSPHLGEHNANRVYQPTESYPTMNMPRPMDMFPGQIDADRVSIRPNSQKIESMEMDEDMIKANYGSGNANANGNGNGNGNGNTLPHVLTYSSDMSQQLASGSGYLEQSYNHQQHQQHQQQQHHHRHPYMPRPTMSSSIYSDTDGHMEMSMYTSSPNINPFKAENLKYPGSNSPNGQLVNFNGNFISLDVFQKSILPLMTKSSSALNELGNVEVITCQPGVRQPNQTDCTRYFVCSKKDGKVLSYSCPPYTGFNKQTRICDAPTYAQCGNAMPAFNGYTIDSNRRLQMEAIKMLSEAKRRQEAALKAQSIANLLQQYGNSQQQVGNGISSNIENDPVDSYAINLPEVNLATTTSRPTIIQSNQNQNIGSSGPAKKRKYYCKEGDKIPDQTSISSYFVCYKNAQGQMKGHKMSCSKSLLFCPKTLMCTLASKCTD